MLDMQIELKLPPGILDAPRPLLQKAANVALAAVGQNTERIAKEETMNAKPFAAVDRGNLRKSWKFHLDRSTSGDLAHATLSAGGAAAQYSAVIDQGGKWGGKYPPFAAVLDWMSRKFKLAIPNAYKTAIIMFAAMLVGGKGKKGGTRRKLTLEQRARNARIRVVKLGLTALQRTRPMLQNVKPTKSGKKRKAKAVNMELITGMGFRLAGILRKIKRVGIAARLITDHTAKRFEKEQVQNFEELFGAAYERALGTNSVNMSFGPGGVTINLPGGGLA